MRNLIFVNENRKKKFLPILLFFTFIISLTSISAAPAKFSGTTTLGLDIEHPISPVVAVNQTHKFHFHVFNSSSGLPIKADNKTINCTFHLYNPQGSHILKVNVVSSDDIYDYEQVVPGKNLSSPGTYAYVFQCNGSVAGGYFSNTFDVTPKGNAGGIDTNNLFWIMIILTWGAAFIGFFGKSIWVSVIGGMGMIIFGIYTLVQGITIYQNWVTQSISYFSIGLGAFFSIYSLIEFLEEQ